MTVKECQVIQVFGLDRLNDEIAKMVDKGFQPHGDIVVTSGGEFLLVMVTVEDDSGGGSTTVTAADITDATTVGRNVLKATDAAAARSAIGAGIGNSNLTVGTSASQAKAGNYTPTAEEISNASAIGRSILKAADAAAVKTLLGIS